MDRLTKEQVNSLCDDLKAAMLQWRGESGWEQINKLRDLALQSLSLESVRSEAIRNEECFDIITALDAEGKASSLIGYPVTDTNRPTIRAWLQKRINERLQSPARVAEPSTRMAVETAIENSKRSGTWEELEEQKDVHSTELRK